MSTIEIGRPAAHASALAAAAARAAAAAGALCVALCAGSVVLVGTSPLFAALGALGAAVAGYYVNERGADYARAAAGVRAERAVAAAARAAAPVGLAHGVLLGAGGDADHVVVGPCCAVIETKYGRSPVEVTARGVIANGRRLKGDPFGQATRQAAALSKLAGVHVEAVVCISEMTDPPIRHRSVIVCGPRDLAAVLRAAPAVLVDSAARRLMLRLSARATE